MQQPRALHSVHANGSCRLTKRSIKYLNRRGFMRRHRTKLYRSENLHEWLRRYSSRRRSTQSMRLMVNSSERNARLSINFVSSNLFGRPGNKILRRQWTLPQKKKKKIGNALWLHFFCHVNITLGWLISIFGQRFFPRLIVSAQLFHTFMRKNVMDVSRSTVDLRSINFSWDEAGKLLRYMDKSMRRELCNWSSNLTNFSFYIRRGSTLERR